MFHSHYSFLIVYCWVCCIFLTSSTQSNAKIEELLQEDHNAKHRREKYQKQSSLLSKLTRQLSIHDNRAASYGNDSSGAGKLAMLQIQHYVCKCDINLFVNFLNLQREYVLKLLKLSLSFCFKKVNRSFILAKSLIVNTTKSQIRARLQFCTLVYPPKRIYF